MEEKLNMCSNGSSGARSASKKIKQSKVPQRGLGVEKLERIRLEEQRKNGTVPSAGAPVVAVPVKPYPSHLYQSLPSVQVPQPSFPFPSASQSDVTCVMDSQQTQNDYAHSTNSITASGNVGSAIGWPPGSLHSDGISSTLNLGLFDGSSLHIPSDFKPNWPPVGLTHWRQHNQPQFSSLMNTSSLTSTPSTVNFKIEPPSIQNTYGNYSSYMHHFYPEDKMIGMKRSWPFSLDCLADSSVQYNATSPGTGTSIVRDSPASSISRNSNWKETSCELKPKKRNKEDGPLDGGSLSLDLPASTLFPSTTYFEQPSTFPPPDYEELSKIDVLSFQGSIEDQMKHSRGFIHQQYSFFPKMEQDIVQAINNSKTEVGNGVDLTLKL